MSKIARYFIARTCRPLLVKYLSATRMYRYGGITLEVPPQVFHPGFFFSTKYLLRYLRERPLDGKTFLELGAGAGLLSVYAAKKNAAVVATDINPVSVRTLKKNASINQVGIEVIHSDLFEKIPRQQFDVIAINPPYYKKYPLSEIDHAWYCGEQGEYFEKLFSQLRPFIHEGTEILMVLCDGCDMEMIGRKMEKNFFKWYCLDSKTTIIEKNFIYRIVTAA